MRREDLYGNPISPYSLGSAKGLNTIPPSQGIKGATTYDLGQARRHGQGGAAGRPVTTNYQLSKK